MPAVVAGAGRAFPLLLVAGAEEGAVFPVPDGEGEIADQVVRQAFSPGVLGAQDQRDIGFGCVCTRIVVSQFPREVVAGIDADITEDPGAFVEGQWLVLVQGFGGGAQQCVSEYRGTESVDVLRVRADAVQGG